MPAADLPARPSSARLASAVRSLVDVAIDGRAFDPTTLDAASAEIEAIAQRLEAQRARLPAEEQRAPSLGERTPLPSWACEADDAGLTARGRFTNGHVGPPGCVHGGWIAFAFDEILSFANADAGVPAMTAHLGVRYRKPTPINADVEFRVRRPTVHGRRVTTHATLSVAGAVTAESDGLFVMIAGPLFPDAE